MSNPHDEFGDDDGVARRSDDVELPVDPEWIASLEQWLKDNKVSKRALAKRIGADPNNVIRLCAGEYETSADVLAICRATNLPPPMQKVPAEVQGFVQKLVTLASLSPEMAKAKEAELDVLIAALQQSKPKK